MTIHLHPKTKPTITIETLVEIETLRDEIATAEALDAIERELAERATLKDIPK